MSSVAWLEVVGTAVVVDEEGASFAESCDEGESDWDSIGWPLYINKS